MTVFSGAHDVEPGTRVTLRDAGDMNRHLLELLPPAGKPVLAWGTRAEMEELVRVKKWRLLA